MNPSEYYLVFCTESEIQLFCPWQQHLEVDIAPQSLAQTNKETEDRLPQPFFSSKVSCKGSIEHDRMP